MHLWKVEFDTGYVTGLSAALHNWLVDDYFQYMGKNVPNHQPENIDCKLVFSAQQFSGFPHEAKC